MRTAAINAINRLKAMSYHLDISQLKLVLTVFEGLQCEGRKCDMIAVN